MSDKEKPVLDRSAVAAILKVQPKTISQYLVDSRGERRYAKHPFPRPDGFIGRSPWWHLYREAEIKAWDAGRLGQGAGGGRPRKSVR